jgi:hypothetical protein
MNITKYIEYWDSQKKNINVPFEVSKERLIACMDCEFKNDIPHSDMECTHRLLRYNADTRLSHRIFLDIYNPCPIHQWNESDKLHFSEQKCGKTII